MVFLSSTQTRRAKQSTISILSIIFSNMRTWASARENVSEWAVITVNSLLTDTSIRRSPRTPSDDLAVLQSLYCKCTLYKTGTSLRRTPRTPSVGPAVFQSFYCKYTLYKTGTSLRLTPSVGPAVFQRFYCKCTLYKTGTSLRLRPRTPSVGPAVFQSFYFKCTLYRTGTVNGELWSALFTELIIPQNGNVGVLHESKLQIVWYLVWSVAPVRRVYAVPF